MTRIQGFEQSFVKRDVLPVKVAQHPRYRRNGIEVDPRIGGDGHREVRQPDATENIAVAIAQRYDRWGYRGNLHWWRRRRLSAIPHPPHHVVVGRILRPVCE